jgi:hypothetical protein
MISLLSYTKKIQIINGLSETNKNDWNLVTKSKYSSKSGSFCATVSVVSEDLNQIKHD